MATGQTIRRLDNSTITPSTLDKKIDDLIKAANVHGLAISIFNDNKVVYKNIWLQELDHQRTDH